MIAGRWGRPDEVLLDLAVNANGVVSGVANPGRENAPIELGTFDATTGSVHLEGTHRRDGQAIPFSIDGQLEGRTLRLRYAMGEDHGEAELVRVEEYVPRPRSLVQRIKPHVEDVQRWFNSLSRPRGADNARRLRERGESIDALAIRDPSVADIPALAELHVTTWNATYNTTRGPTIATRAWQWTQVFANPLNRDIVFVLEEPLGRLVGFVRGKPADAAGMGNVSKIYLRWEYHGLGLGRQMMGYAAQRFLERGVRAFNLFAERSNPTIGFYDRLGGERLLDEHGEFHGGYVWRDLTKLAESCPVTLHVRR